MSQPQLLKLDPVVLMPQAKPGRNMPIKNAGDVPILGKQYLLTDF